MNEERRSSSPQAHNTQQPIEAETSNERTAGRELFVVPTILVVQAVLIAQQVSSHYIHRADHQLPPSTIHEAT